MAEDPYDLNKDHYFLDKSQLELERLNLGQIVFKNYMKKLVWAPVDFSKPVRVLDSGAANGNWSRDVRNSLPEDVREASAFVSTDVTDVYFPDPQPEGITFLTQSMLAPWPTQFVGHFDLVHQRLALPAAPKAQVQATIRRYLELVKPGGWIQFVEADHSISKGPAMADFFRLVSDVFKVMDTGNDYAPQIKGWLTALGLEDVDEKIFDVPLGAGNVNEEMKEKSARMMDYGTSGLIQVGRTIPTSFTEDELGALLGRIHEENMSTGGLFRLHCVWGRKPVVPN